MRFILFLFVSFSACASNGLSPLHLAAGRGNLEEIKTLLSEKADLFTLDPVMGISVLHKAVYSGNAEVVSYLLDQGALIDLQSPSNGDTPLHDAIYFKPGKDTRVIEAILKRRPNLYYRNKAGLTPLESATVLKDEETIRLIQQYEASLFSKEGRELMRAVKANDSARVEELLTSETLNFEEADEQGFTPLIWAAREGQLKNVELLLKKGANPNALDQWMRANAGHKAAFWGRAEVMSLLIAHGLEINAQGGYNGYTALHDAVARGHGDVIKVLLENGARTDIKGHDGKTALDLARNSNIRVN